MPEITTSTEFLTLSGRPFTMAMMNQLPCATTLLNNEDEPVREMSVDQFFSRYLFTVKVRVAQFNYTAVGIERELRQLVCILISNKDSEIHRRLNELPLALILD